MQTHIWAMFLCNHSKRRNFPCDRKYPQILLHNNIKAVPYKSHFFLTRVTFLGHLIERNTITPLKSRIDATQKLQPPSNKKKIQEFL